MVKDSSSAEEKSAGYQPGLLLLLAGDSVVTIFFAAIKCVAVTLCHQVSLKLFQYSLNTVIGNKEHISQTRVKIIFSVLKLVTFLI